MTDRPIQAFRSAVGRSRLIIIDSVWQHYQQDIITVLSRQY